MFLLLVGTLIAFQPLQASSQSPTEGSNIIEDPPTLELSNCYLNADMQSTPATEMNTITNDAIVKTIHVEKETYVCKTQSRQTLLADVYVYTEIIDNFRNQTSLKRNVEVLTCAKNINVTAVKCVSERPPTELPTTEIKCSIAPHFRRPVLMNTVSGSGNITESTKSIESDSRIFSCRDPNMIQLTKSLVTFIERYENLDKMITNNTVETLTCIKEIVDLKVVTCNIQKVMYD
jgi:hypothetical protein